MISANFFLELAEEEQQRLACIDYVSSSVKLKATNVLKTTKYILFIAKLCIQCPVYF